MSWETQELARVQRMCRKAADLTDLRTREMAHWTTLADRAATLVRVDLTESYTPGNVVIASAAGARMMDALSAAERKLAATGAAGRA